jgi:CTP synthase
VYGVDACTERHRHRYEVNPAYIDDLEAGDLTFSGTAGRRMEIVELADHPYFIGTQFHPEFRSRPDRASPPFVGLVDAVLDRVTAREDRESGERTAPDAAGDETEVELR